MRQFAVLLAAVLASCAGDPAPVPSTGPVKEKPDVNDSSSAALAVRLDLLAGLERRVLDNGLVVLVKEDHRLPIATTVVAYRVGSVHEREGATGLAHFLEHMMFKGTPTLKKGEIDRLTYAAGGFNNAYTTNDLTSYWFTVHADELDRFLQIEADRMRNCLLDRGEWESELEVVMEELNRGLDRPWGKLLHHLEPEVFKESSYHHPVIGFREDLEKMKHEAMVAFYRDYYGPNNATLVVVGDVRKEQVFDRVKVLFGPIQPVKEAVPSRMPEPPQTAERRLAVETDKELHRMAIAWRSDRVGTDADIRLDVLSRILTTGNDSRLYKRLVVKDRLCTESVDSWNDSRRYDGVFTILAELNQGADPAMVERSVLEEIEKLRKDPVGDRELRKAKNLIAASFVFAKERGYGLADDIGRFEAYGCPDHLKTYLARVEAVTAKDLQELALRIFRPTNRTVAVARAKANRHRMPPSGPAGPLGDVIERRLDNGLTILIKVQKHLPVVAVHAYFDAGPTTEADDKAGVAELLGRMLDQGVDPPGGTPRNAEQLAEEVEFTGSQLATSATGATFKTLTTHELMAYDVIRDVLRYPTLPADKLSDQKQLQLSEIKANADAPEHRAQELFLKQVYGAHPMHRPPEGFEKTVSALTRDDVVAHYRARYRPDNGIVAVVGDVDPGRVLAELEKRFGDWKSEPRGETPVVDPPAPRANRVIEWRDTNQINYVLGHLSVDRHHPDYFRLRVLEHLLCRSTGFADRLSKVIRDDNGWAYEVWGVITQQADRHPGPFMIYIGTAAKNGSKPLEETLKLIEDVRSKGPTPEEVELAKSFLLRSQPFSWETTDQLASYLVTLKRLKLGMDYGDRYAREIKAVTPADVARVAKEHLKPEALTTVIVGPVDKDGKVIERK